MCYHAEAYSEPYQLSMINSFWENSYTAWKVSKYGVISGPYFLVFGLNTETFGVNLCIQSKYRGKYGPEIWTLFTQCNG